MVEFWDQAHYIEEELRQKKTLTPLSRFRVRRRNPPPRTICASGVRKTSSLPKDATAKLKTWYFNHESDPYPTVLEKQQLARVTGLTIAQVKTWFANARRRSKTHHSVVVDPGRRRSVVGDVGIENYTTNLLKSSSYCKYSKQPIRFGLFTFFILRQVWSPLDSSTPPFFQLSISIFFLHFV